MKKYFLGAAVLFLFHPLFVSAAAYILDPVSGVFTVGSTFEVSVFLDTNGKSVNALDVDIRFPPDKLQLVSQQTGLSVISVWTSQPRFNNQTGTIRLQGGMPNGVNLSKALVATLTFRVKSVGTAIIRFGDEAKILLNDGLGTDDLTHKVDGVYKLVMPPPAGPTVVSETHPDQEKWYPLRTAVLSWASDEEISGYSYILDKEPLSLPDDTVDSGANSVAYENLSDGRYYFHIKAMRSGFWGGVTHFTLKIDGTPPAAFQPEILPGNRTTSRNPVVQFATTDNLSGLDRYELKVISLSPAYTEAANEGIGFQPLFFEAQSPYILSGLTLGSYDVVVRVFDKAGNVREATQRLNIVSPLFSWVAESGLIIAGVFVVPWFWFWSGAALLVLLLVCWIWVLRKWHWGLEARRASQRLPPAVQKDLEELKKYRAKYGRTAVMLFVFWAGWGLATSEVLADSFGGLPPPIVTTVSQDITNEEIFYIGGRVATRGVQVLIYAQNLSTGDVRSYLASPDENGEWFYRHDTFLPRGDYRLWTQGQLGNQLSPPGPQIRLTVRSTALQFGVSRLSYEVLYLIAILVLVAVVLLLVWRIVVYSYHGRRKQRQLMKEIREAEELVRRGFAVLRRDLQRELEAMRPKGAGRELTVEEKSAEAQLLTDLAEIERRIGKEIWDVEKEAQTQ